MFNVMFQAGMESKCGFQMNHNISIWTSPNLTTGSWSYAGNAIDVSDRPAGIDFFLTTIAFIVFFCSQIMQA